MSYKLISNQSNFTISLEGFIKELKPNNFVIFNESTYKQLMTNSYFKYLVDNKYICTSIYDNKITNNKEETNNINYTTTNSDTICNSITDAQSDNSIEPKSQRHRKGKRKIESNTNKE